MILKYQLRWAGHVSRMEDHRLPKIVLYGELSTGHRERGAPKKRFKDSLKRSLTTCNIDHKQWSDLAADRVAWRHTIHQAAAQFEADRRNSLKDETEEEGSRHLHHYTRHYISLQTLLAALPLLYRSGRPRACLQSTITWTTFINLRSQSQAMMMMMTYVAIKWLSQSGL